MAQFFVPIQINPAQMIADGIPSMPPYEHPYFTSEKQAEAYLRDALTHHGDNKDVYFTRGDSAEALTFGPDGKQLHCPQVTAIYRVEVTDQSKLDILKLREKDFPFIGRAGYAQLNPSEILSTVVTAHPDILHDTAYTVESRDLSQLSTDIRSHMAARIAASQRFAEMLERSTDEERSAVNMHDPNISRVIKDAYAVDGFCHRDNSTMSPTEKTLQTVQRQIVETTGAHTVLSVVAIQEEFNARLEAMPPETSEAERVAVAMEGTLAKFVASIPARDISAVNSVRADVRGTVHETEAERDSTDITQHELGEDTDERDIGE